MTRQPLTRQFCNSLLALTTLVLILPLCVEAEGGSWLFRPGKYSHHPATGERLNQFAPLPEIAALPDSRPFTSGYTRQRVLQRGANGTQSDYTRVENWGNGRGGIDAEWERVNKVWQRSVLSGGYGYGGGNLNYRDPSLGGFPGYGTPPGFGGYPVHHNRFPNYGYPGYGAGGNGGPGFGARGYGNGYGNPLPFDSEEYDPWRRERRHQRPWNEPPVRRDFRERDRNHGSN